MTSMTEEVGSVRVDAPEQIVAGSMECIKLIYTAGKFGIDDQGSIRLLFRFASDSGRPQWERPNAPNYVTAEASNGAKLALEYHPRGAIRPWFKAFRVNVMKHFLKEGDQITVTLGDRRQGSAGYRIQTLCEPTFEIRVQADPWGTVLYRDVRGGKAISVVPGEPVSWVAVLPTLRAIGERFSLRLRADDRCGNPTDAGRRRFRLVPNHRIEGLPEFVDLRAPVTIENLRVPEPCDVLISLASEDGAIVATSNPMRVVQRCEERHYWGDFHAQSEETIGTNSARDYFIFARDRAFCDFVGHQGNDFQITNAFWKSLNDLYREFNDPGRFVTIPGYEYSPVTALGGDRNIFFREEHRPIRRSSHALVDDTSDIETDCHDADELFRKLRKAREECLAFAHVGGRYADLSLAHDGTIEKSVEVHSAWGTFEWLLFDAFDLGHRVGVVCNSDDHKGRPGASHPGASIFGAYGGLTCLWLKRLSRDEIWNCLKRRRHYGTTGDRLYLDVGVRLATPAEIYHDDPLLGPAPADRGNEAKMGEIVRVADRSVRFACSVLAAAPVERIELRRGKETLETIRPYCAAELRRRIRIVWEGAEYRGRGRMTNWDGLLAVSRNEIERARPINFWHLDKSLRQQGERRLEWESVTTGNFAGADLWLRDPESGSIEIETPHVKTSLSVRDIGFEDTVFDAGGLDRRVRIFRLPDENPHRTVSFEREVEILPSGDTPLYVRVTLENGHQAWSSPIYLHR